MCRGKIKGARLDEDPACKSGDAMPAKMLLKRAEKRLAGRLKLRSRNNRVVLILLSDYRAEIFSAAACKNGAQLEVRSASKTLVYWDNCRFGFYCRL